MKLIIYRVIEVRTKKQEKAFLGFPRSLYAREEDIHFVNSLCEETKKFFSPSKNPMIKQGEAKRWLLYDVNKHLIGRIAAFYWKNQQTETTPIGYFGFFECRQDSAGARHLFRAAGRWLKSNDINKMQGPFYLGGPGFFTGSLIHGFYTPAYGIPYNFSYYNDLFMENDFEMVSPQQTYNISMTASKYWQFVEKKTSDYYHDLRYYLEIYSPKDCNRFAKDFTLVYNKVWLNIPGMAPMTFQRALGRCRMLRPLFHRFSILFMYYEEEPVAFLITVPDIHQVLKKYKGENKLVKKVIQWLALKIFHSITTLSGLIYAVVPEHKEKNIEADLLDSLYQLNKFNHFRYKALLLNRVGDFAPEMKKIAQQLGAEILHEYTTYQIHINVMEKWKKEPKVITN